MHDFGDRKMADAPERIWLQRPCRDPENEWFGEVTWCGDKINDDDTEYVRADEVQRQRILLKAATARAKAYSSEITRLENALRLYATGKADSPKQAQMALDVHNA